MAKDPAFLFYPGDWLGGTIGMTFEEKGAYMELLMMQFTRGHMTTHMIGQVVGQLWDKIKDKFEQDEDGLWFNARLDEEKNRRKRFVDSRKNNKKGTNQHTKPGKKQLMPRGHMTNHMTGHMENENENENRSVSIKVSEYFERFWNAYGHKIKRAVAERAFVEAAENTTPEAIIQASSEYAAYCTRTGRRKQDPANWLKEKAFQTDWLEVARNDKSGSKQNEKQATRQTAFEILQMIEEDDD